jgi:hypothetical protein
LRVTGVQQRYAHICDGTRNCPGGHGLKPAYARDDWTCDNANNLHVIPRGSLCYGCRLCNHDISKACYTT